MKITDIRNYPGRNIYIHKPVIKMIVDVEDLAEIPTNEIPGFNNRLLNMFPGLENHYCSKGYEGGFYERLREGTFAAHVTEHLALELECLIGYDVYFGKTRQYKSPSLYCIVFEYTDNAETAIECGRCAVDIIAALADNKEVSYRKNLDRLRRLAADTDLGPSTKAVYMEAQKRNIPVERMDNESLLRLGYGKYLHYVEASLPDTTSCIAVDLAKNKQLTKLILGDHNIPVPLGEVVNTEEEAVYAAELIGYPVAVKPYDGNQGRAVTTNISRESLLRSAYRLAKSHSGKVVIEQHIYGKDYRVLVVGNQVVAAAERTPPGITGDGIHSIAELVDIENQNPDRGTGHEKPLTKIKLDQVTRDWLDRSDLYEDSIPARGRLITLRENGNLSTGGQAFDVTDIIHPANKNLAIQAAQAIGLEVAGIDLVAVDISRPVTPDNGAVIEVNAAPGLRMHLYPTRGQARNVAAEILNYIYPPGSPASIPIIAVTGSNGKTTVTRLINHILSLTGQKVGMTCTSGTYIGGECIARGDNTGPLGARMVLTNREADVAVLETARGGIIKRGLGYDLADVGIVVNISEDHLGLDGINNLEDMAFVKSIVAEAVKPEGYAVLNADDPMTAYIAGRVKSKLVYFSQNPFKSIINSQINQGNEAVIAEENLLVCYKSNCRVPMLAVEEIPITFGGKAVCNIENALAAAAGLLASGVSEKVIAWGLRTFKPDPWNNAGRFNLFSMGDFQVLLDYGHNLCGYESVIKLMQEMEASRLVGVIGMPGDREDQAIYEVGKLSGQFLSRIYIKEDRDLRSREPGETAHLLYRGAIDGGACPDNIEIISSETEALEKAIADAREGDLIAVFYENFDGVFNIVQKHIGLNASKDFILPQQTIENIEAQHMH